MIYDGDKEYFEAEDADTVDNFDKLNEKYRNNVEWIKEHNLAQSAGEDIVKDDNDIIRAFKNIFSPAELNLNEVTTESEYISGETDPYQRIINLKQELLEVREKIDEDAQKFKSNHIVNETENYNKVLEELDLYKTKIDSFINYKVFNNTSNASDSDSESGKSQVGKKEFTSLCEKYNRIAENLVSQIKLSQNDLINNNVSDLNIHYEIVSNPEIIMENLSNRVNELEDMVSNLEHSIGNWNMVKFAFINSC